MVCFDLLRQNGRRDIAWAALAHGDHSFLTDVLGAFQREDIGRLLAVPDEEFCLKSVLREVLDNNSWLDLKRQSFDKSHCDSFIIFLREIVILDEIIEVDVAHVCSMSHVLSDLRLS